MPNQVNLFDVQDDFNTKYTTKVNIPQYLPSGHKPPLVSLFDNKKYMQLMNDIENSSVSEQEKEFLRLAAARHIVFNYAKIADYYANSSKEVQKLMEDSALVIIDVDDAIANGYIQLSSRIRKIMKDTGKISNPNT